MVLRSEAVNSQRRIVFCDLFSFDLGQGSDRVETGVLGKGQRDGLQGVRESSEGVLLDGLDLENESESLINLLLLKTHHCNDFQNINDRHKLTENPPTTEIVIINLFKW